MPRTSAIYDLAVKWPGDSMRRSFHCKAGQSQVSPEELSTKSPNKDRPSGGLIRTGSVLRQPSKQVCTCPALGGGSFMTAINEMAAWPDLSPAYSRRILLRRRHRGGPAVAYLSVARFVRILVAFGLWFVALFTALGFGSGWPFWRQ